MLTIAWKLALISALAWLPAGLQQQQAPASPAPAAGFRFAARPDGHADDDEAVLILHFHG
jgi:hypothetical protein